MLFFLGNIALDDIMQNLLNLRVNFPMRFLPLSLLISYYTLHNCMKLVKKKLQEESSRLYGLIILFPLFFSRQVRLSFWQVPLPPLLLLDHQSISKGHFLEVR